MVASVLILFLRELDEPLLTFPLYTRFLAELDRPELGVSLASECRMQFFALRYWVLVSLFMVAFSLACVKKIVYTLTATQALLSLAEPTPTGALPGPDTMQMRLSTVLLGLPAISFHTTMAVVLFLQRYLFLRRV